MSNHILHDYQGDMSVVQEKASIFIILDYFK